MATLDLFLQHHVKINPAAAVEEETVVIKEPVVTEEPVVIEETVVVEETKVEPAKVDSGISLEDAVFLLSTLFRMSRMDIQFPDIAVEDLMQVQSFLMQSCFRSRDEMHADFMKLLTESEDVAVPYSKTSFSTLLKTLQKVSQSKIVQIQHI